jgi:uncharacterized protein YjbI with pentapeptide repeats
MKFSRAAAFVAVLSLWLALPCCVFAQEISYSNTVFKNRVDYSTFKNLRGVEFRNLPYFYPDNNSAVIHRPVYFFNAHFDSIAKFNFFDFRSTAVFDDARFKSAAEFNAVSIDSSATFRFTHFASTADFRHTHFRADASFHGVHFDSTVSFNHAEFDSTVSFSAAKFTSPTGFSSVHFHSNTSFYTTIFASRARFSDAYFHGRTSFVFARFDSTADFSSVRFDSTVTFSTAEFHSFVDFSQSEFYSTADFTNARFLTKADFSFAKLKGKFVVVNTTLPDFLDFRHITDFPGNIDFTFCKLDTAKKRNPAYRCKIALYGSDISKISINMDLFELWFPTDFATEYGFKRDYQVDMGYEQKVSVYEKVLKKLQEDGFTESYQRLDIEYQKLKLEHNGLSALARFQEIWWNFGYNKEKVFRRSGALFLGFFALFLLRFRRLYDIYTIEFLQLDNGILRQFAIGPLSTRRLGQFASVLPSEAFRYVFHVFVYTLVIFFGVKLDLDKFRNNGQRRTVGYYSTLSLLLACYFVGLFCTAYIINIIFNK